MPLRNITAEEPIRPLRLVNFPPRPASTDLHPRHAQDRAEFLRVCDNLGMAVLVCDSAGRLVHQSEALGRLLDAEPESERIHLELRRLAARPALDQRIEVITPTARYLIRSSTMRASWTTGNWPVVSLERVAPMARTEGELSERFGFTPAQARVASLLVSGRSSKQIAADLGISWCTVRRHTERIYMKAGVRSRAELVARASGSTAA